MTVKRLIPSAALAIGVTCGIGIFMASMIAIEFTPQEKSETLGFEINPEVLDIPEPRERKIPKQLDKIETPPPPPRIDTGAKDKPKEAPVTVPGKVPDMKVAMVINADFKPVPTDGDVQPLVRIPPVMPPRAERSGHCKVSFDVTASGQPINVQATYCTQPLFARPTIKSVQNWKFKPRIQNGESIDRKGLNNLVRFRLTDERGNPIPE